MKYQHKEADIHIAWKILLTAAAIGSAVIGFRSGEVLWTKISFALLGLLVAGVILWSTWGEPK